MIKDDSPEKKMQDIMKREGVNLATGVPCGVLKTFINNFETNPDIQNITAQNEPEAIGIGAGAYLGGKTPVIYMQNSGMLKSTNEIGSLLIPYKIPILNLVTYRGCEGEDAPQHFITGKITKATLDSLGLFYEELNPADIEGTMNRAHEFMRSEKMPAVVLVRRGIFNPGKDDRSGEPRRITSMPDAWSGAIKKIHDYRVEAADLQRENALETIIGTTNPQEAVFSATGLISRSLYEIHDASNQFYVTGSFGLVSSIGLGFSLAQPTRQTTVIDGDGSILTNLGTIVTIGKYGPGPFTHVVLDNNAYGSCSGERTCSDTANLPLMAATQGYKSIYLVNSSEGLKRVIADSKEKPGPTMIYTEIGSEGRRDFKRPLELYEVSTRFKDHFKQQD